MRKFILLFSLVPAFFLAMPMSHADEIEDPAEITVIDEETSNRITQNIIDFRNAVENARAYRVKELLQEGVNPNIFLDSGDTPLTHALRYDRWPLVEALLSSSLTDINMPNALDETPIMIAVFKNRTDFVEAMIERGASVKKASGWTALHYAATDANIPMIKRMLELGADVNAQTKAGITPLHMAARKPSREAVMILLRAGAYRDYCTDAGLSPADFAVKYGDKELGDYLAVERCAVVGPVKRR